MNGGSATVGAANSVRTDWQKVKDVLYGKRPISDIENNCSNVIEIDLR
ncbi:hypothetical protein DI53_3235 [Sphingobacterium deserti]|uniref:Uncharacterized protein n=1 Tax=Sphingobacterium deserti TaxID=1229276 RepID=A0A0B8T2F5_9SPHI|nr:hypothetical protein DI53_3235 [Sphingobacterium deserti]